MKDMKAFTVSCDTMTLEITELLQTSQKVQLVEIPQLEKQMHEVFSSCQGRCHINIHRGKGGPYNFRGVVWNNSNAFRGDYSEQSNLATFIMPNKTILQDQMLCSGKQYFWTQHFRTNNLSRSVSYFTLKLKQGFWNNKIC